MVQFLFRKAIFPILVETDSRVFGVPTPGHFNRLNKNEMFQEKDYYQVIDSRNEMWFYHPNHDVISPLTFQKQQTKKL